MEITAWIGVVGLAALFGLVGAFPFRHGPCDGCSGEQDCPRDAGERVCSHRETP